MNRRVREDDVGGRNCPSYLTAADLVRLQQQARKGKTQ